METEFGLSLLALPDFSSFWIYVGLRGNLAVHLRFTTLDDELFDFSVECWFTSEDPGEVMFNDCDVHNLIHAAMNALELYTGKHPERRVRCKSCDRLQLLLYRILLKKNHKFMATLFSIDEETIEQPPSPATNVETLSFILKRKLTPPPKVRPTRRTLITYRQLFGYRVYVHMQLFGPKQPNNN